jgi:hypothetical protein
MLPVARQAMGVGVRPAGKDPDTSSRRSQAAPNTRRAGRRYDPHEEAATEQRRVEFRDHRMASRDCPAVERPKVIPVFNTVA